MNSFNFIGYLMRGGAAEWHRRTSKEISEKFGTWKIYEKIPPHITIFQPFDTNDLSPAKNVLKEWKKKEKTPGNFLMNDFGHFDDRVIFAKIEAENPVKEEVEKLRRDIKNIPNMPKEDFPIWHPHATLINRLPAQKIKEIWNYVSKLEKPNFILPFDNVTIFKFTGNRRWETEEVFET